MKVRVTSDAPAGERFSVRLVLKDQRAKLTPPPSDGEFSGSIGAVLNDRFKRIMYVGLGDRAELNSSAVRRAAGSAALILRKHGQQKVLLLLEERPEFVEAAVEGFLLGAYRYEDFTPKKTEEISELAVLVRKEDVTAARKAAERGCVLAESINAARHIGNAPGNVIYPETLARHAATVARRAKLQCKVMEERSLRSGKFGGILSVGAGSERSPRLIALEYRGGGKNEAPLVLIGKAITFDSGGISLKPAEKMEEMIFDKCGGIAVLGAMEAIARLKIKRNVVGLIAAAENMPGGSAFRPGDIIQTRSGVTVEIVNTDAEGRLVLADALSWAREHYKASAMVNLATLTGACGVALGESHAGLWSNHGEFLKSVQNCASKAGEKTWHMPLGREYSAMIKSSVAQIKNSAGRLGGACTAAAFLQVFAGETKWAHLDIAYTARQNADRDGLARGATGFGIRTLVALAESRH
jgi:leucyl aminopeptidase